MWGGKGGGVRTGEVQSGVSGSVEGPGVAQVAVDRQVVCCPFTFLTE